MTQFRQRTMEDGTVVTTFQELREYVREKNNLKTFHGIPKNENKLIKYAKLVEMQDSLSKGHLSEKHIDQHKQNENAKHTEASDRINAAVTGYMEKTGIKAWFETAARRSRLDTYSDEEKRAYHRVNKGLMKAGSGRQFSLMMRNSPYRKRSNADGTVRYKLIRPVKIVLNKISEARFNSYVKKGLKNAKGITPQYQKVRGRVTFKSTMKTQVVHPN